MEIFNLSSRIALVTGGTRGIGLAIALGLKKAGAEVWIHGRSKESTEKIANDHGFSFVYGDLREPNKLDEMLLPLKEKRDTLDILINNAGYETFSPFEYAEEKDFTSVYNINAKSPFFLTQKLLPMLERSGKASIINVTSIHQKVPVRENIYYCMAKSALAMFTKVTALELAGKNIRVNNLAPGAILTDMNRELVEKMEFNEWIPMGRVGEAEELAGPAVFLASDAASYITGTTLYVDGGYSENLLRY